MTEQQIAEGLSLLHRLGIKGSEVYPSANGEYYWVSVRREHNGHFYSHSQRLDKAPSDQDIDKVREAFEEWWKETTRDQIPQ